MRVCRTRLSLRVPRGRGDGWRGVKLACFQTSGGGRGAVWSGDGRERSAALGCRRLPGAGVCGGGAHAALQESTRPGGGTCGCSDRRASAAPLGGLRPRV